MRSTWNFVLKALVQPVLFKETTPTSGNCSLPLGAQGLPSQDGGVIAHLCFIGIAFPEIGHFSENDRFRKVCNVTEIESYTYILL